MERNTKAILDALKREMERTDDSALIASLCAIEARILGTTRYDARSAEGARTEGEARHD